MCTCALPSHVTSGRARIERMNYAPCGFNLFGCTKESQLQHASADACGRLNHANQILGGNYSSHGHNIKLDHYHHWLRTDTFLWGGSNNRREENYGSMSLTTAGFPSLIFLRKFYFAILSVALKNNSKTRSWKSLLRGQK